MERSKNERERIADTREAVRILKPPDCLSTQDDLEVHLRPEQKRSRHCSWSELAKAGKKNAPNVGLDPRP